MPVQDDVADPDLGHEVVAPIRVAPVVELRGPGIGTYVLAVGDLHPEPLGRQALPPAVQLGHKPTVSARTTPV